MMYNGSFGRVYVPFIYNAIDLPIHLMDYVEIVCELRSDFLSLRIGRSSGCLCKKLEKSILQHDKDIRVGDVVIVNFN